ncbi:MAG: hypothetical protein JO165_00650 [Candidatus Eremiobacteraeota bacterium]|nr:hypothetical protein [Candidatus Eremiobacteraeota bacterium]
MGVDDSVRVRIEWDVRSRISEYASQIGVRAAVRDGTLEIAFAGPFTVNERSAASVDAVVFVPSNADIAVVNAMGRVKATGLAGNLDLNSSMGRTEVELAAHWAGERIAIRNSMGVVQLSVPRSVRLAIHARTALGKQLVKAPSFSNAPPALLQCGLGKTVVRSI